MQRKLHEPREICGAKTWNLQLNEILIEQHKYKTAKKIITIGRRRIFKMVTLSKLKWRILTEEKISDTCRHSGEEQIEKHKPS